MNDWILQRISIVILTTMAGSVVHADETPAGFTQNIRPLLESHCFKCHNAEKHKGDVDFASLTDDSAALSKRKLWRTAAEQIESGEMPPADEEQFAPEQKEALLKWMHQAADHVADDPPDPGPAPVRRLTRAEYDNTIRDLAGIDFNARETVGMPDEDNVKGFDNLAAGLSIPHALLEKYFTAADKILDALFAKKGRAREAFDRIVFVKPGGDLSGQNAAKQIITKILRRAWRRPPTDAEVDKYLKFFLNAAATSDAFEDGVRAMLKPVLVSPHFLFRIEQDRAPDGQSHRISNHELATRLSYFLWSTMPDEELSGLADSGKLQNAAVLEQQVKRMLTHSKARTLTEQFAVQWLQLDRLDRARPSTEFFPSFNGRLRSAMRNETTTFFDKLREEDRSVLELLDSDYTWLNADLAKHYGIPNVTHQEFKRVSLKPGYHRGGLLGMGSVLAMTSHTFRTSPTQRGQYILDVIFGTPPPPPPANAGFLKNEQKKDPRSFREQLAQHASDATCAGCHKKMDPLGFALDNYDAVGAWRGSTPERPLDTTGQLPTGEKISGIADLKQIMHRRQDEFVHHLIEQTLSYALGREIQETDERFVREVQTAMAADGHRFSALVLNVVRSFPFQYRKKSNTSDNNKK